ncbi:MAG: aspartate aminotransferase [Alphaproteobacteria bacterium 64-6]|nr:aminotransferase class I/II-fold pyridoxal phosphate-dependent enzyme [Hyphomicrobium sp.]OJU31256.1 MAG: aspartate aminotransferase [Alphaproteobacteria bacterium 64-6]
MTAAPTGLHALAQGVILSPFTRLRRLLEGIEPGISPPIEMMVGEPREVMPSFVPDRMVEARETLAKYPPIRTSEELRKTIGAWIERRYGIAGSIDALRNVHPLNGSREGLFFAILPAVGRKVVEGRPVVLLPNPMYHAYLGATYAANCEPVFLDATAETGFLPDLDELEKQPEILVRTVAFYLCSPANPQGAVASPDYIRKALALARQYNFMLFFDECYSEIYTQEPPIGGLQVAAGTPEGFKNIIVFNSLSKRSNLPGLRSGFAAGDADFLEIFAEIRNLTAPQMPGVVQHASVAVWSEEQHVGVIRQAYRAKFDVCDELLKGKFGYKRPAGGFFLWLDMSHLGGSVPATVTLWKRCGVKVVPGAYLAQPNARGVNPAEQYIRVALVHDVATIREALQRIVAVEA